jgi:hypothetical protein
LSLFFIDDFLDQLFLCSSHLDCLLKTFNGNQVHHYRATRLQHSQRRHDQIVTATAAIAARERIRIA